MEIFHWTCLVTGACLVCEARLRYYRGVGNNFEVDKPLALGRGVKWKKRQNLHGATNAVSESLEIIEIYNDETCLLHVQELYRQLVRLCEWAMSSIVKPSLGIKNL